MKEKTMNSDFERIVAEVTEQIKPVIRASLKKLAATTRDQLIAQLGGKHSTAKASTKKTPGKRKAGRPSKASLVAIKVSPVSTKTTLAAQPVPKKYKTKNKPALNDQKAVTKSKKTVELSSPVEKRRVGRPSKTQAVTTQPESTNISLS